MPKTHAIAATHPNVTYAFIIVWDEMPSIFILYYQITDIFMNLFNKCNDYLEIDSAFSHVHTREQAFYTAGALAQQVGFCYLIHAPVRNHPNAQSNWAATTYPTEWQRLYEEKGYLKRNPVRHRALITNQPFRWSSFDVDLPNKERELFDICRQTGMQDGIVVPVHGPWGQAIAIGFACQNLDAVADPAVVPFLHLVALRLHHTFDVSTVQPEIHLTPREREILQRLAQGWDNKEISDVLNISDNSVEWHLKNIYTKLAVRNRTAAVVKAVQMGLLTF